MKKDGYRGVKMTFGDILFFSGIVLMVLSMLILLISVVIYTHKKKVLKQKLYEKYGF